MIYVHYIYLRLNVFLLIVWGCWPVDLCNLQHNCLFSCWRVWICCFALTHWGRVTHICVGEQTIIVSDNGLTPGRRQAIIWTNARILLIWPLGTNFSEMSIEIHTFSFKKIHLKMSSGKWRPFCLGLNVLKAFALCCSIVLSFFFNSACKEFIVASWFFWSSVALSCCFLSCVNLSCKSWDLCSEL